VIYAPRLVGIIQSCRQPIGFLLNFSAQRGPQEKFFLNLTYALQLIGEELHRGFIILEMIESVKLKLDSL
jgi:hypothetical protein